MSAPSSVRLFTKPFCPWCREAERWLRERGVAVEVVDVTGDCNAAREMVALSRQTKVPVILVANRVLADFDTAQLAEFWKEYN
jgi:monothiol glutaredoxin